MGECVWVEACIAYCSWYKLFPLGLDIIPVSWIFWLFYAGFDLSDPEKEKMGILSLQLKEKNVLHSVSFILKKKKKKSAFLTWP